MRREVDYSTDTGPALFDRAGFFSLLNPTRGALRHTTAESLLLFASLENLETIVRDDGIDKGRAALGETARVLASSFRRTDPVAQLSTNLFAVLAIGAGRKLSDLLVQRLRASFQIANLERGDQPQLVIRTGSAYYDPQEPSTPEELFSEATRTIAQ